MLLSAQTCIPKGTSAGSRSSVRRLPSARCISPQSPQHPPQLLNLRYPLSTAYTSSGSHMSSCYFDSASAMDLDFGLERAKVVKKEEQKKHIKSLVREFQFFGGGGDVSAPERWLTELGVGWVLQLADAASAGELGQTYDALMTWIRALAQVVEIIGYKESLFPEQQVCQLSNIFEQEEQAVVLGQLQFAKFFQEAMFKMLPFVDWIVSEVLVASKGIEPPYENLSTLMGVHAALSKALPQIQLASSLPQIQLASSLLSSAQVVRIQHDVVGLLAAKEAKVVGAIWSTMEEIRTHILEPIEDDGNSSGTATLEGSSDILKATRSLISYIELLRANYLSLAPIVSVNYESHNAAVPPLDSMVIEIASCLEEKLAKESESFRDRSLRFLFLFNNSYLISQKVDPLWSVIEFNPVAANNESFLSFIKAHQEATTRKVQSYMESYLQASWAPALLCLFNDPTPLCLAENKNYSPLAKFESEFQKVYTTQKLWKVPDPGLRKTLHKAITVKIMPEYTKYIEDNNITTQRITPRELEKMLQELFEG